MRLQPHVHLSILLIVGCAAPQSPPLEPLDQLRLLSARTEGPLVTSLHGDLHAPTEWFPTRRQVCFDDGVDLADTLTLATCYAPEIVEARTVVRIQEALRLQAGRLENPTLFVGPRLSTADSAWIIPLSLSQPIPLGGRLAAEEEGALADIDVARAKLLQAELTTLAEVRREFIRGASLHLEISTLGDWITDAERVVAWVDSRIVAGESDAVSAFTARAALEEARSQRREERMNLESLERRLKGRVGIRPDARVEFVFDAQALAVPIPPTTDPHALLSLPQLEARAAEYRAAEAALRKTYSDRWPDLALGPEIESVDGDLSIGVGASLELPLFDQNQGHIVAGRERLNHAREAYQRELLEAQRTAGDARASLASAIERLAELEDLVTSAVTARAALDARVARGEVDILEVVSTTHSLSRVALRRIAANEQLATARVDVFVASGAITRTTLGERSPDDPSLEPRKGDSP